MKPEIGVSHYFTPEGEICLNTTIPVLGRPGENRTVQHFLTKLRDETRRTDVFKSENLWAGDQESALTALNNTIGILKKYANKTGRRVTLIQKANYSGQQPTLKLFKGMGAIFSTQGADRIAKITFIPKKNKPGRKVELSGDKLRVLKVLLKMKPQKV